MMIFSVLIFLLGGLFSCVVLVLRRAGELRGFEDLRRLSLTSFSFLSRPVVFLLFYFPKNRVEVFLSPDTRYIGAIYIVRLACAFVCHLLWTAIS